jgi:predicted peroxiredoxin
MVLHMARSLVVKVTVGAEDVERLAQGLTVAATAAASGIDVSLWLTGEATWLALPGRAQEVELEHSAPLDQLLDVILATGRITVCTQCAQRRGLAEEVLIEKITIAGAATFVAEAMAPEAQALIY